MKYPILKQTFAKMADACNYRDECNTNRKRIDGNYKVVYVVRRMKKTWNVYALQNGDGGQPIEISSSARPRHEESELQRSCVQWFRLKYRNNANLLFAVPNGGNRNPREAAIMKMEGVTAGVADLLLLIPSSGFHGLAIEMKTQTGRQSEAQKAWQEIVECNGYKYQLCRSFDEFRETIEEYLPKPPVYIPHLH